MDGVVYCVVVCCLGWWVGSDRVSGWLVGWLVAHVYVCLFGCVLDWWFA